LGRGFVSELDLTQLTGSTAEANRLSALHAEIQAVKGKPEVLGERLDRTFALLIDVDNPGISLKVKFREFEEDIARLQDEESVLVALEAEYCAADVEARNSQSTITQAQKKPPA
jgi:hypothetical protein